MSNNKFNEGDRVLYAADTSYAGVVEGVTRGRGGPGKSWRYDVLWDDNTTSKENEIDLLLVPAKKTAEVATVIKWPRSINFNKKMIDPDMEPYTVVFAIGTQYRIYRSAKGGDEVIVVMLSDGPATNKPKAFRFADYLTAFKTLSGSVIRDLEAETQS